jgi:outer membrane protein assembly factor BamB
VKQHQVSQRGKVRTETIKQTFAGQTGKLPAGTILEGRYEIERVLGVGGMGAVYAAHDLRFSRTRRLCAIKEMLNPYHDEHAEESRAIFEREANILASLSHPAIPKVYDYFSEGDRYFLVQEFIDGKDLEAILDELGRPMPPERVVDYAIQVCEVLFYLHNHRPTPVIFRDLKPANIMLCEDGHIVLVDFGIAKQFQPAGRGTMIGTEGYAPPEQYRGIADPRVDIYALGATMHHLLTNIDPRLEPPFSFHERQIAQINPDASPELVALVERALAYEPHLRFRSAQMMRQALESLPESRLVAPQAARPGRPGAIPTKPVAPPSPPFPSGGRAPRPAPIHREAPAGPAVASRPQEITPLWVFRCEEEVRSSPAVEAGTVYIGCYDYNLYALDARTGEFKWKYPTEAGIASSPCVWQDLVIVGSEDRLLYAVRTKTGRIAWTLPTKGCIRSSPRALGEFVFVGSDDHGIYAVGARNGQLRWKFEAMRAVRSSATFTESCVVFGSEDCVLYALDYSTGKSRWKFRTGGPIVSTAVADEQRLYVGSMDWLIYALDVKSGWPVWQYRTGDRVVSSPALADDRLYIGSVDEHLYCLDARWGKLIWRTPLGGQVTSSPAVSGDRVYVGAANGTVFCLQSATGKIVWRYATQGPVPSSPAVVDGVVYIGSMDHHVYALPA